MNNTQQIGSVDHTRQMMIEGGGSSERQRVRQRARGVGDNYIDTEPMREEYNHQYTYKTFTPMFIIVIVSMVLFYFGVV